MTNHMVHHAHRDLIPPRSPDAEGYGSASSSRDPRFEFRERPFSSRDDAIRYSNDPIPRARPSHHAEEAIFHFAPPPPLPAFSHGRPHEPSHVEPSRCDRSTYPEAQSHPFGGHSRSRVNSDSHRRHAPSSTTSPQEDAFAFTLSPRTAPHSDPPQAHHARHRRSPQHHQQSHHLSLHDLLAEPTDVGLSAAAWRTPRAAQTPVKRSLPVEHLDNSASQTFASFPRPYTSSGSLLQHPYESPSPTQTRTSSSAATPRLANNLHDHRLQEHPLQPPAATLDAIHRSADRPITPQHLLQPYRKRLRISRACDECRRRKTRCDIVGAFPGEPAHPLTISGTVPPLEPNTEPKGEMLILQPCMNCRRSDVVCSYSKRPLKRGPSKGYIKDLERRLNSLESQIVSADRAEAASDARPVTRESVSASATDPAAHVAKPKIRTEARISRLESVLSHPLAAKVEEGKSAAVEASQTDGYAAQTRVKAETEHSHVEVPANISSVVAAHDAADSDVAISASAGTTDTVASSASSSFDLDSPVSSARWERKSALSRGKGKVKGRAALRQRSAASSPSRTSDADIAKVRSSVVASNLHATFPVVPARSLGESSSSNIARLEDRVLARGLKLLAEPVEMATAQQDAQVPKAHTHAARVASLVGQASAGLGGPRDELVQQAHAGADGLQALRKVAHRLAGQEADLLMLCHLDQLRNARSNNAALAAAVSKLGLGGSLVDGEMYRRRTLLFMLDRWHAVGFGTPHLLVGRFGMERSSFRSMKQALGDVSQSALGDAVFEVLRCGMMLGQLNDLVQSGGGWKAVSGSDVDAVIHSAMDDDERPVHADSSSDVAGAPKLLSTAALRCSLESVVRCYHALHTLPSAKEATMDDLQRVFRLAEAVVVLGTEKTPVSLQGKLVQSGIGPHVLAVVGVAFAWCLRVICMMVASTTTAASSASASTVNVSPTSLPLEFYRRKVLDYARMCGPFCLFSGGAPASPASFAPVYLRLALHFNTAVALASSMGSLVAPHSTSGSAVLQDASALGDDADGLVETAREMGCLGYVLAATRQGDA
ncbi:conserved hypothetical protein [Sporisorium reilianum SRZ2]|uniref:Zn(2)-C6 fungal-type domain-containing protein n=1 Tax=Sporisorium reilianum (strain SRZ2) TaxID=999809 RepID=E6ZPB2_SPORE|nr:conserved hypothetical protein [Sporisorium reilianum SRZ2]